MKWAELEYFFSQINAGESILDIACGSGRLVEQYKDYFWEFPEKYLGIDISVWLILEAQKNFPSQSFQTWDMRSFSHGLCEKNIDAIFCIAWLHHLENIQDRKKTLTQMKACLKDGGKIFLTNWSLHSWENLEKYKTSQIWESKNIYNSYDYRIKIWKFSRYYHSFSLHELENLAKECGLKIFENRLFDTGRNTITILGK